MYQPEIMNAQLYETKLRIDELAAKIGATDDLLPTYGGMRSLAHPYFMTDSQDRLYFTIISERGEKSETLVEDLNSILYWIFEPVTLSMANNYALNNRKEDKDSRRIIFAKQEELLGILDEKWKERTVAKHTEILFRAPFDDLASLRAIYCGQLREQGYSEVMIYQLASAKYPRMLTN